MKWPSPRYATVFFGKLNATGTNPIQLRFTQLNELLKTAWSASIATDDNANMSKKIVFHAMKTQVVI